MRQAFVAERPQTTAGPRPALFAPEGPFISVVVPVRNEEAFLEGALRQLLHQDYDPRRFEVLVADGGSTDRTREVVEELCKDYPNLRLLDNPGRWSSAGRNAGIRAARGDLVVVVDGHCQLNNPEYLADLADAFARSGADCVGRPQPLDVTGASPLQLAIALARASRLGHHPDSHIYSDREGFVPPESVAVAYRREVFDRIGLFDESFDACEDVEFNRRLAKAGLRCFFTPRVAVHYHPRSSLKGLFRQMIRYGRGRIRLLKKHPDTLSLKSLVPALWLAGLVVGPLLCAGVPALWPVYLGTIALYLAIVVSFSIGLAVRAREPRLLPWFPAIFAAVHAGAGTGLWLEFLSGSQRKPAPAARPETEPIPYREAA